MEPEFSTSTWMLLFFVLFLLISIWKISAFLPNRQLEDDDTTQEATEQLEILMLKVIDQKKGQISENELFLEMGKDENFDSQLFWRFNLNRLKQLLNGYYLRHPECSNILEIYQKLK